MSLKIIKARSFTCRLIHYLEPQCKPFYAISFKKKKSSLIPNKEVTMQLRGQNNELLSKEGSAIAATFLKSTFSFVMLSVDLF